MSGIVRALGMGAAWGVALWLGVALVIALAWAIAVYAAGRTHIPLWGVPVPLRRSLRWGTSIALAWPAIALVFLVPALRRHMKAVTLEWHESRTTLAAYRSHMPPAPGSEGAVGPTGVFGPVTISGPNGPSRPL